jgi:hypothetical protein
MARDTKFWDQVTKERRQWDDLEIGKQIARLLDIQKIESECYEPMGWLGKKTLRFERRFGLAP